MSISDVKGDHMDILFKNDDFVFSYRVGGILIHNEKILLQRPKNDDYAITVSYTHLTLPTKRIV